MQPAPPFSPGSSLCCGDGSGNNAPVRLPARWILLAVSMSGCLDAAGKNRCEVDEDCLDERACVRGICLDRTCEVVCTRLCESARACGDEALDCSECGPGSATSRALGLPEEADACRGLIIEEDSCDAIDCAMRCSETCEAALACEKIVDLGACLAGCNQAGCELGTDASCDEGPIVASCYELRGLFGEDVLCNAQRPCETAGFPCDRNGHCCGFWSSSSVCVSDGEQAHCADICEASVECVSECCLPLDDVAYGACGEGSVCL